MAGRWIAWALAAAFWAALWIGPAWAEDGRWWRAESANFIVYGDRSERQVRDAAQALEDFDATLRALTRRENAPAPEAKLEVYLVRGARGLRQVAPGVNDGTGGFYAAGGDQIAAFVRYDDNVGLTGDMVLFHEYAHHYMLHYFPNAYPRWYVEGWAEYVSTVEVRDRRAIVGTPSPARTAWIRDGGTIPIENLLAPERMRRHSDRFKSQFYAHAWFAALYISNNDAHIEGLERYVRALGEGADPLAAFEPAFGVTMQAFERELRAFKRGHFTTYAVTLPQQHAQVSVTRLARVADDLLLALAGLRAGVSQTEARLEEIERLAARHGADPLAQLALAHLHLERGDLARARGHVETVLAANETDAEARYLLAQALVREAADASDAAAGEAAIGQARRHLVRGFRANPLHYPTLYLYAATFAGGSQRMDDATLNVLARALELAPQVDAVRLLLAREMIKAEQYESAAVILRPLIYAPHGGADAVRARVLFDAAQARQQPSPEAEADALAAEAASDDAR